uniref:Uncharacterized protein n=1 Tax=Arundo donax TaxID=35708 RepID=A0A0A9EAR2_ARUDO
MLNAKNVLEMHWFSQVSGLCKWDELNALFLKSWGRFPRKNI